MAQSQNQFDHIENRQRVVDAKGLIFVNNENQAYIDAQNPNQMR